MQLPPEVAGKVYEATIYLTRMMKAAPDRAMQAITLHTRGKLGLVAVPRSVAGLISICQWETNVVGGGWMGTRRTMKM